MHEIRVSLPWAVNGLPGGYSEREPPDPIPNSEVKLLSADDSVGFPHVKVGHRQALKLHPRWDRPPGFSFSGETRGGVRRCVCRPWRDNVVSINPRPAIHGRAFAGAKVHRTFALLPAQPHVKVGHRQALKL